MTPVPRGTVLQKYIVFEIFSVFGIFNPDAWDRFFYNEIYTYENTYTP